MVDVENNITFAHIKVPGDDRGGVDDLNQNLAGGKEMSEIYRNTEIEEEK